MIFYLTKNKTVLIIAIIWIIRGLNDLIRTSDKGAPRISQLISRDITFRANNLNKNVPFGLCILDYANYKSWKQCHTFMIKA